MADKSDKRKRSEGKAGASRSGGGKPGSGERGSGEPGPGKRRRRRRRPPPSKKPIFKFVVGLLVLLGLSAVVLASDTVEKNFKPSYLRGWAKVSAAVLNVFGENARVDDSQVSSRRFQVNIKEGCDALWPTVLFLSAVIASPVAMYTKLPGIVLGLAFLLAMNLVRVLSLFYIGIYWESAFHIMHHDVWQALFIIMSIAAWATWAIWAVGKTTGRANVTS